MLGRKPMLAETSQCPKSTDCRGQCCWLWSQGQGLLAWPGMLDSAIEQSKRCRCLKLAVERTGYGMRLRVLGSDV